MLALLGTGVAQAAVVVTDLGATTPTGFETANTVLYPAAGPPTVFGLDGTETHGQTFTIANTITLAKIYIGYGGYLTGSGTSSTITLTVDKDNDGGAADITEAFTLLPGDITQGGADVVHWLELDVSSHNLALGVGTHSFLLSHGGGSPWLLAPTYTREQKYAGGNTLGLLESDSQAAAIDANFAISPIPEPASLTLLGLGALALLRRRRG